MDTATPMDTGESAKVSNYVLKERLLHEAQLPLCILDRVGNIWELFLAPRSLKYK